MADAITDEGQTLLAIGTTSIDYSPPNREGGQS
jgi:hypothetical protein